MAVFGTSLTISEAEDGYRYTWQSGKWLASVRFRALYREKDLGFSLFIEGKELGCDEALLRAVMSFAKGHPLWVHRGATYWYKPRFMPDHFDLAIYGKRATFDFPDSGRLNDAIFVELTRHAKRRWQILRRDERKNILRIVGADPRKWNRSIECAAGYKPSVHYKLIRRLTDYFGWLDMTG